MWAPSKAHQPTSPVKVAQQWAHVAQVLRTGRSVVLAELRVIHPNFHAFHVGSDTPVTNGSYVLTKEEIVKKVIERLIEARFSLK